MLQFFSKFEDSYFEYKIIDEHNMVLENFEFYVETCKLLLQKKKIMVVILRRKQE